MSLKERVYSVLVVSAAQSFHDALADLLPASHYAPVRTVTGVGAAKRLCSEESFDLVLVNSPLPDGTGVRFAIDLAVDSASVVLLLVRADQDSEIRERVAEYGVYTLSKPVSRSVLTQALDWMAVTKERLRASEKKTLSIEEKMEEIRIVNRAKWLLISEVKMDEPDAHRYIEKQAMDRCVSKRTVAEEIIKIYS